MLEPLALHRLMTTRVLALVAIVVALLAVGCDDGDSLPTEPTTLAVQIFDTPVCTPTSSTLQLDVVAQGGDPPYSFRITSPALTGTATGNRVSIAFAAGAVEDVDVAVEVEDNSDGRFFGTFRFSIDCSDA